MCMLLAEVVLLCYLMGEVREVQLYSKRSQYWLLVSALVPSAILCLDTLGDNVAHVLPIQYNT